jgi:hypothetical protein
MGWSADGDGVTKTIESIAPVSTGTSNFPGCSGGGDFSDPWIIFGTAFSAGASCRGTARGDDFSSTVAC